MGNAPRPAPFANSAVTWRCLRLRGQLRPRIGCTAAPVSTDTEIRRTHRFCTVITEASTRTAALAPEHEPAGMSDTLSVVRFESSLLRGRQGRITHSEAVAAYAPLGQFADPSAATRKIRMLQRSARTRVRQSESSPTRSAQPHRAAVTCALPCAIH